MLFLVICSYMGAWACASAAVGSGAGRWRFWLYFGLAVMVVPLLSALGLALVFRLLSPAYGASITPLSVPVGMVLAVLAYPLKYLRLKQAGGR